MTFKYVIYHANCNDGLSAAALHKILTGGKDTIYLPGYYHKKTTQTLLEQKLLF